MLQLPLDGPLERGGLSFVLKRPPGRGAEWLKSAVGRDFFLDFSAVRAAAAGLAEPLSGLLGNPSQPMLIILTGWLSQLES